MVCRELGIRHSINKNHFYFVMFLGSMNFIFPKPNSKDGIGKETNHK